MLFSPPQDHREVTPPTPDGMLWEKLLTLRRRGFVLELFETNRPRTPPRWLGETFLGLKIWDGRQLVYEADDFGAARGECVDSPRTLAACLSLVIGTTQGRRRVSRHQDLEHLRRELEEGFYGLPAFRDGVLLEEDYP